MQRHHAQVDGQELQTQAMAVDWDSAHVRDANLRHRLQPWMLNHDIPLNDERTGIVREALQRYTSHMMQPAGNNATRWGTAIELQHAHQVLGRQIMVLQEVVENDGRRTQTYRVHIHGCDIPMVDLVKN